MEKRDKALVVFSGGQDSTTCLFWALKRFKEVAVVTFDYGQRHALEIDCATKIANEQQVKQYILNMDLLNQLAPNALTRDDIDVQAGENGGLPNTFVPGRNLVFFSFAGILARQIGAQHIITGVSEADFSGYPDCRDNFMKSLNVTINLAMDEQLLLHTPLMWRNKAEVWALADELGVLDYIRQNTLTCYNGIIADGCGECPSCLLRKHGLELYLEKKVKA
ncbi:7-cyano-7-deazaguanine synthase [Kurthia sp. 3B1D]|uniref:7-cyano-7-deazaguanine synthase n=1 Tax=Candidatus Kurthia intestinigallinarum TaxID=1562256 RepID=A0A433RXP7_9BACL|nr:7-cyano-7-deazaguanine synthase QueC [Kurthia sp. 3B1D]RUS58037.1 7-cyano-7-deazaguanine synthase [Kurthia sp. 3B1D]